MQLLSLIGVFILIALGVLFFRTVDSPQTTESTPVSEATSPEEVEISDNDSVFSITSSVEVYDGISVPKNATILDVSGQGLEGSLKAEVRLLSNLKVLDVSNNNFTGLPAEVGQLSELEVLNLSNNPFTGLPNELGNLRNLQELDLRGTQYSEADVEVIRSNLPDSTVIFTD